MKISFVLFLFFGFTLFQVQGQENVKTYTFKEGEVLDIVLIHKSENADTLFNRYKKTVFPVGFEYSYQPQSGFTVSKLTLGTNKPDGVLFGKWESKKKREGFLTTITKRVPDFHQQRRALFPYFGLTYYEIKKDVAFSVDASKYNVMTALWQKSQQSEPNFFEQWKAEVLALGGEVIITLENGTSPTGYYYNPDILCMVAWKDEKAFNTFAQKHPLSTYNTLKNVHQFAIQ
ncbi:hypothetical protein ACFO3O_16630 [Dokdonia ponticola]|uniref:DUF1330 domain-containing protein n=1 Tax=Dokdonia ponticola TaxID=2041041 RepID=A0ABV9I162_9FLAO